MRMKLIIILTTLIILASSVMAGTCTISGTSGIDYTDGANITVVCADTDVNETRCFSKGTQFDSELFPESIGTFGGTLTFAIPTKPESHTVLTSGCENNLDCYCYGNVTGTTTSEANDTCTVSRVCFWDYETGDLDDVIADNIGTAGVEFKNYMPLIILGVVTLILGAIGTAGYIKYKRRKG